MVVESIKSRISISTKWKIKRMLGFNPTMKVFRDLERTYGRLPSNRKAECDDYAQDVLGNKVHAQWLYIYTLLAGEFKVGWIPDTYYSSVVVPNVKGKYGNVSELKAFQALLFGDSLPDVLYRVNKRFWDARSRYIPDQEVKTFLFNQSERVVFKADLSMQGKGVVVLSPNDVDASSWDNLGDGVYQSYIHQHPALEKFHQGSVATLRMTTVVDLEGEVSLRGCYLRFGTGTDSHVKSASQVKAAVNRASGRVSATAYTQSWQKISTHPDSNHAFANTEVPGFDRCLAKVKQLHNLVPFVQCIGWDVAVDRNSEPVIIEWNGGNNDIKFTEVTQGPCFADLGWEDLWRNQRQ